MTDAAQHGSDLPVVGPWAKDKLDRLDKYLRAYTTILNKQKWCEGFVYIDAFAGAGQAVIRASEADPGSQDEASLFEVERDPESAQEEQVVINGSPRVALSVNPPFTQYLFVERDPDRRSQLEALAEEFGHSQRIRVVSGDCNDYLRDRLIENPRMSWKRWRALVFLDPFGMQVPWSTIEGLGATKAIEVFINFPVGMAIQRLLKRSGEFTEKERAKLDDYFGSPDWFNAVYTTSPSLFGDEEFSKAEQSGERLVAWYRDRLKETFGHVSAPHLVRNSRGGHLYYLIHAGPNATGSKIASYVLGNERVGRGR